MAGTDPLKLAQRLQRFAWQDDNLFGQVCLNSIAHSTLTCILNLPALLWIKQETLVDLTPLKRQFATLQTL
jgi:hypothetical protein